MELYLIVERQARLLDMTMKEYVDKVERLIVLEEKIKDVRENNPAMLYEWDSVDDEVQQIKEQLGNINLFA